jgi:tRNA(Arg) A34 adenosine deaminase TadA/phosphoglycolate phosphatase-like HAD superfamily hydrolase
MRLREKPMALDALIFDIDGTLADTNAAHIEAWQRALMLRGYTFGADRIFKELGQPGERLVPALIGAGADSIDGGAIRAACAELIDQSGNEMGFRIFERVGDLLIAARTRGLKVILATLLPSSRVTAYFRQFAIDLATMADAIVSRNDEKSSLSDLLRNAVQTARLSPTQCAMVGDTPFDARACIATGIVFLGLCSGGHTENDLVSAGARAVWRDCGDLLDHLDQALAIASPGPVRLDHAHLERLMQEALRAAEEGIHAGEAPIGCVLARGDGSIIARGYNEMNRSNNKISHAEIVTFNRAAGKVPMDARDLILVSTLEPCVMCTGAAMEAAVDVIVYGMKAPADSGTGRVRPPQSPESQMPRIIGGILAKQSRQLFERWLATNSNSEQAAYVKQLLALNDQG